MSLKKTKQPTQTEVNNLIAEMTMDQIRATDTFRNMPTRFFVHGRDIPKSALRRNDLAKAYLMHGGTIIRHDKKQLKHFRPPTHKKTSLEKKHDRHKQSLTQDHKGDVKLLHHAMNKQSLKRPPARFRFNDSNPLPQNTQIGSRSNSRIAFQGASTSDETDELTDDMMSWSLLDQKRQRLQTRTQTNNQDSDNNSDTDLDDVF